MHNRSQKILLHRTTTNPSNKVIAHFVELARNNSLAKYLASITADILSAEGIADASILAKCVWRGLIEEPESELCLGMVDFWPASVLIRKDNDTRSRCGLVDWKYFRVSSAPSELGMFRKYSVDNRELTN